MHRYGPTFQKDAFKLRAQRQMAFLHQSSHQPFPPSYFDVLRATLTAMDFRKHLRAVPLAITSSSIDTSERASKRYERRFNFSELLKRFSGSPTSQKSTNLDRKSAPTELSQQKLETTEVEGLGPGKSETASVREKWLSLEKSLVKQKDTVKLNENGVKAVEKMAVHIQDSPATKQTSDSSDENDVKVAECSQDQNDLDTTSKRSVSKSPNSTSWRESLSWNSSLSENIELDSQVKELTDAYQVRLRTVTDECTHLRSQLQDRNEQLLTTKIGYERQVKLLYGAVESKTREAVQSILKIHQKQEGKRANCEKCSKIQMSEEGDRTDRNSPLEGSKSSKTGSTQSGNSQNESIDGGELRLSANLSVQIVKLGDMLKSQEAAHCETVKQLDIATMEYDNLFKVANRLMAERDEALSGLHLTANDERAEENPLHLAVIEENAAMKSKLSEVEAELLVVRTEKDAVMGDYFNLESQMNAKLDESETRMLKEVENIRDGSRKQLEKMTVAYNELEAKNNSLQSDVHFLNGRVSEIKRIYRKCEMEVSENQSRVADLEKEREKLLNKVGGLSEEKYSALADTKEAHISADKLNSKNQELEREKTLLQEEIKESAARNAVEQSSKIDEIEELRRELVSMREDMMNVRAEKEKQQASSQRKIDEQVQELAKLRMALNHRELGTELTKESVQRLAREKDALGAELRELKCRSKARGSLIDTLIIEKIGRAGVEEELAYLRNEVCKLRSPR